MTGSLVRAASGVRFVVAPSRDAPRLLHKVASGKGLVAWPCTCPSGPPDTGGAGAGSPQGSQVFCFSHLNNSGHPGLRAVISHLLLHFPALNPLRGARPCVDFGQSCALVLSGTY